MSMMLYLKEMFDSEQVEVRYLCVFGVFVPGVCARRDLMTKH